MMLNIIGLVNYGLVLIFGIVLSLCFAGVSKRNRREVIYIILILLLVQIISWRLFGYLTTRKLYPIIIHIPLALFISFFYKRRCIVAFISVFCAYLCCQTLQWFAIVVRYLSGSDIAYLIANSLAIIPVFYLIKRYVISSINRFMNTSRLSLLLFGTVPFLYYVFDYVTTVYTNLLYEGMEIAVLFMPSVISMFFFVFIILHDNEIQRRCSAENESMMLSVQIEQSKKNLDVFWDTQEKASIYRHDMRHHLNLIAGFLAAGDISKSMEYITQVQSDIKEITPTRYCENNTVNLILSYYADKVASEHIAFSVDVQIPQNIAIPETELCALFSNGLDNATNACLQIRDNEMRIIHINCKLHKGNLLIFIENSYTGELETENGLPKSSRQGHGFGTKSMKMIIDKYKGYYSFTAKDGVFALRIVLPLSNCN